MWLNMAAVDPGVLFFADSKDYLLACLAESDQDPLPWQTADGTAVHSAARTEDSPLVLADEEEDIFSSGADDDGGSELEDTFHFKREAGP
jgi:hypothetical protein